MKLQSILDNDLYKLTMQFGTLAMYPDAHARYQLINRAKTQFPNGFANILQEQVEEMVGLKLTNDEVDFLREKCPYFSKGYIDFIKRYRYDPNEVTITQNENLEISVEGPWTSAILWEVPLMALISELYLEMTSDLDDKNNNALEKGRFFDRIGVTFVDFGTRRRFSYDNHDKVVKALMASDSFKGTSNIHLAMKHGITPVGTQAHEWVQFHSAKYGFRDANLTAMDSWLSVFGDNLKIVLTDTFGTQDFFRVFDRERAEVFSGVRQDSGSPLEFLEDMVLHYENLGIDPETKVVVFSDSLNPKKVEEIHKACGGRVKDTYGIGTNLTNDVGVKPLNMVIKMIGCKVDKSSDWKNVIKLSDDKGKHTGDVGVIQDCIKELYS